MNTYCLLVPVRFFLTGRPGTGSVTIFTICVGFSNFTTTSSNPTATCKTTIIAHQTTPNNPTPQYRGCNFLRLRSPLSLNSAAVPPLCTRHPIRTLLSSHHGSHRKQWMLHISHLELCYIANN
ncbi:unnamed protein product [Orchesella dallaii]|uniref:Uncharacterized protein n=1 Tax=Orchesella dallaii TaxID=48710 RepID=A0ABP1PY03_9HEXA